MGEKVILESEKFKELFLLEFTRELIENSGGGALIRLKNILKKAKEGKYKPIEKIRKEKEIEKPTEKSKELSKQIETVPQQLQKRHSIPQGRRVLNIPEPKLPERFKYLKPTPSKADIELGKLDAFVKDPNVLEIECPGIDQGIVVHGTMGTKPTGLSFSKEEIKEVLDKFSKKAMIPLNEEGATKIVIGNLILNAFADDEGNYSFRIKKMTPQGPGGPPGGMPGRR
jgi:hypothetical protein